MSTAKIWMEKEICFLCNQKIIGKSYFSSQSQENSDILCQILNIQMPGLGKNEERTRLSFEKISYCRSCVDRLKIVHDMLTELERLKKQISEETRSIQLQLKVIYDYCDSQYESNNSALQFRTAIINELNFKKSEVVQEESLENKKNIVQKFISRQRKTIVTSKHSTSVLINTNSTKNIAGIDQSFKESNINYNNCSEPFIEQEPVIKLEVSDNEYMSCQSPGSADNNYKVEEDPLAGEPSMVNSGTQHINIDDTAIEEPLNISTKINMPKGNKAKTNSSHVSKIQSKRGSASCTKRSFCHSGTSRKSYDNSSKLKNHRHIHNTQEKSPQTTSHHIYKPRRTCIVRSSKTSSELIEKALNAMKAAKIPDRVRILPEKIKKNDGSCCYKCKHCEKTFITEWHLKIHERQHTGEIPNYNCNYCDQIFTVKYMLRRHNATHTSEEKGLKCQYCGKICKNKTEHKIHERIVHNDILKKDFMCGQCGKTFLDVYGLRTHERTHTNDKPFVCQFCGQNFRNKNIVKNHERTHTGEKPFKCTYCEKYFRLSQTRKIHERSVHTGVTPYKCKYCQKLFSNGSNFKRHELTHTQERPYPCRCCGKKFPTNTDVKVHMRTHPGEKPYKCQYCELQFSYSKFMKDHLRLFHADMGHS